MWLSDTSVKRPVFATVLSLMLLAIGALSFRDLTVREYPDTVQPTVQVQVGYPGASSEIIETRITQVLEAELSGIEGVKSIRSQSRDGQSSITVEFFMNRKLDEAANDVRDRVSRVSKRLPDDVDNISVQKADADSQPIMWLTLSSGSMSLMDLTDYTQRYLLDRFATIPGVSQINVFGSGGPSMRVWIDRLALAARNLTVTDIETALTRENLELPAGRIVSKDLDFQVRISRNYETADQFRNLVISQGKDGHLVRLGEVADVVVASRETTRMFRTNGQLTTGFGIIKQSTANTVEVLDKVKAEVERVNANLPPGMKLITSGDDSLYIRAAIQEIYWTIAITTALVGFVIFIFLGSIRATLIPLVTIPVCLIATFSVLIAVRLLDQPDHAARARALDRPRRRRRDRRARERASPRRGGRGAAARRVQRHAPGRVRGDRDDRRARVGVRAGRVLEGQHRPRVRGARGHDRGLRDLLRGSRAVAVADDVLEAAALEHRREQAHARARSGVRVALGSLPACAPANAARAVAVGGRHASRSAAALTCSCGRSRRSTRRKRTAASSTARSRRPRARASAASRLRPTRSRRRFSRISTTARSCGAS